MRQRCDEYIIMLPATERLDIEEFAELSNDEKVAYEQEVKQQLHDLRVLQLQTLMNLGIIPTRSISHHENIRRRFIVVSYTKEQAEKYAKILTEEGLGILINDRSSS